MNCIKSMMTLFSIIKVNAIETQDENEKATDIWNMERHFQAS